ncbi:hypothetical protein EXE58_16250 [Nocardioides seonyuensis]|uniref:Sulfotransferase family protein n=1 Tax=Nocardioides seonyuensis TaxID=2518371 RepID=A0A4P7IKG4_9ACTN|nr:hypothetical protein [Nocardioides seonyuensis]QBX56847.1 hypothetical protein EXE58_16250 [Nocardioides seonyuensis]
MIASHEHRFIFIKTRKTAGTSLEIALSRHCGPDDIITPISPDDEVLRRKAGGRGPQHHDTDPSCYAHMTARRVVKVVGRSTWDDYFTFAVERNPFDVVASSWRFSARKEGFEKSFAEFVRSPRVGRLARNERLYRLGGAVAVDHVYRYEDLGAAVVDLGERFGIDLDLPHAKASSGPHYRDLYGPGDAEIVAQHFARTIREFGYEF